MPFGDRTLPYLVCKNPCFQGVHELLELLVSDRLQPEFLCFDAVVVVDGAVEVGSIVLLLGFALFGEEFLDGVDGGFGFGVGETGDVLDVVFDVFKHEFEIVAFASGGEEMIEKGIFEGGVGVLDLEFAFVLLINKFSEVLLHVNFHEVNKYML